MTNYLKIGFFINPVAGLGGKVALKGTDGLAQKALSLGATPVTPDRAKTFLIDFESICTSEELANIQFFVPPNPMGEELFSSLSLQYSVLPISLDKQTTSQDTIKVIHLFESLKVSIIVFAGGDGTSIDIGSTIKTRIPILGIPSGVKTYGSVFAHSPQEAAVVLQSFYYSPIVKDAELLDLDEEQYRKGILSIKLIGFAKVPAFPEYFQQAKERSLNNESEETVLIRIAEELIEFFTSKPDNSLIIIGPGSTFNAFSNLISIPRSILGIDCIEKVGTTQFKSILMDAREDQIFNLLSTYSNIYLLITPIGGLGYILGRGNHQVSPRIINTIPKVNIIVVSSQQKLSSIKDGVLRIDTSDQSLNKKLSGFVKVITDYGEMRMIKIVS